MENIYHGANTKFSNLVGTKSKCQGLKQNFCFITNLTQTKNY